MNPTTENKGGGGAGHHVSDAAVNDLLDEVKKLQWSAIRYIMSAFAAAVVLGGYVLYDQNIAQVKMTLSVQNMAEKISDLKGEISKASSNQYTLQDASAATSLQQVTNDALRDSVVSLRQNVELLRGRVEKLEGGKK